MAESSDHEKITIIIDKKEYHVDSDSMTGTQLRNLPNPPIGPDYDLFEIVPGGNDQLITDDETVELKSGDRFFSAPKNITPGSR